jgi:hypothetical protein
MAGYIGSKAAVVSSGSERKKTFTITTTTTSLTGLSYTPNFVHVFHNGIRLVDGTDYTATNGTSITLTNAAEDGDEVVVVSYASFQTSDTVSASAGGTFSNPITIDGDGETVLTVDRATSDGTIIDVQKDGASVGGIGTGASELFIGGGDVNLTFNSAGDNIYPSAAGSTSVRDGAVDLGLSFARFKDLYLSGGVYLGGTGSANYLDDYEEGIYTVSLRDDSGNTSSTSYTGYYTKIGNMVTVEVYMSNISSSGMTAGDAIYFSLPFVGSTSRYYVGGCIADFVTFSSGRTQIQSRSLSSLSDGIFRECGSGVSDGAVTWGEITASSSDFFTTLQYRTTA